MIKFNKEDLTERRTILGTELRDKVCIVEFTKVDGTRREMPCTLDPTIIPPTPVPVHETNTDNPVDFPKVKKQNPNTMSVWCTDKQSWRSFRLDNVISVKAVE